MATPKKNDKKAPSKSANPKKSDKSVDAKAKKRPLDDDDDDDFEGGYDDLDYEGLDRFADEDDF